jgi:hypothetical protein
VLFAEINFTKFRPKLIPKLTPGSTHGSWRWRPSAATLLTRGSCPRAHSSAPSGRSTSSTKTTTKWFAGTDFLWFLKKFSQKLALLTQNKTKLCKKLGFWGKCLFCRRKLSKIAENFDHNIEPRYHYSLRGKWFSAKKNVRKLGSRSIHNGHRPEHEDGPGEAAGVADGNEDDGENPPKFRLILYPQPEHKSEEGRWSTKAL